MPSEQSAKIPLPITHIPSFSRRFPPSYLQNKIPFGEPFDADTKTQNDTVWIGGSGKAPPYLIPI